MYVPHADRLRLYRTFKAIRPGDFQAVVSYYEIHEAGMRTLDFDAWFDCTLIYCQALFDAAQYGKHLVMCDHLLHTIMENSIVHWGGEDWYIKILHQKTRSLICLREYQKAEHILQELVKMHPYDRELGRRLLQVRLHTLPSWRPQMRALLVIAVLFLVILMTIETFVLPMYPHYLPRFEAAHSSVIALALGLLLLSEWYHLEKCRRSVEVFVQNARKPKY